MRSADVSDLLKRLGVLKSESAKGVPSDESAAEAFLALMRDPAARPTFVADLFPAGVRPDQTFFDRLAALRLEFNYTRSGDEGIGLVWSEAMRPLSPEDRQALLHVIPTAHNVFEHLGSLWVVIRDHPFPPTFLAEWLTALVRAVERDILQGGAWTAIRTLCTAHPKTALAVLRLLPVPLEVTRLNIAGFMLGVLRTEVLDEDCAREYRHIEASFNNHADVQLRGVVMWSWATTARERSLTQEELAALLARSHRSADDLNTVVRVACHLLISAPEHAEDIPRQCRQWIEAQVSPGLSAEAKHAIVSAAKAMVRPVTSGEDFPPDVCYWILAIRPVGPDDIGTWQLIGATLCEILKKNRVQFTETFERLCEGGAATMLRLLRGRNLQQLHMEMHRTGVDDLVGRLCVSPDMDTRRLGLALFDSLDMAAFPRAALTSSSIAARLVFHEFQRVMLSPKAIARLLIAIASSAEATIDGFRSELFDELKLQAHNFAGECRTELLAQGGTVPLVKQALDDVATYFADLDRSLKAGISGMEVAGHRQAATDERRRFSRQVAESAESHSMILRLAKQVRLLYGCATSQFLGGILSDAMSLAHTSVSMEMPLVELCDPEEMAMRRVHASIAIDRLLGTPPDDAGGESAHG
jgi:hypothetical protein